MRGVKTIAALSVALSSAMFAVQSDAADIDDVRALAREKAAAVGLMKGGAAGAVLTLAQDRLFTAYLDATTQGEVVRLKARINHAFATLAGRFGLREFELVDRSGVVVTRVVMHQAVTGANFDAPRDPVLAAGFAQKARSIKSTVVRPADASGWTMSHVAPISRRGQNELILRAKQDGGAYQRVLAIGTDAERYVVLADQNGRVLSDSRLGAQSGLGNSALTIGGQSLQSLRRLLRGNAEEGSGKIRRRNKQFNVAYRTVGKWTVVAIEPVLALRLCSKNGERQCS